MYLHIFLKMYFIFYLTCIMYILIYMWPTFYLHFVVTWSSIRFIIVIFCCQTKSAVKQVSIVFIYWLKCIYQLNNRTTNAAYDGNWGSGSSQEEVRWMRMVWNLQHYVQGDELLTLCTVFVSNMVSTGSFLMFILYLSVLYVPEHPDPLDVLSATVHEPHMLNLYTVRLWEEGKAQC